MMGLAQKYEVTKTRAASLERQVQLLINLVDELSCKLDIESAARLAVEQSGRRFLRELDRIENPASVQSKHLRQQVIEESLALQEQKLREFFAVSQSRIARLVEDISTAHGVTFVVPSRPDFQHQ